jgi:hypothetical protein
MKAQALAKLFRRMAQHNVAKAKSHRAKEQEHRDQEQHHRGLAEHFAKMADMAKSATSEMKDSEADPATLYRAMAGHHEALADSHAAHADSHAQDAAEHVGAGEACSECAKVFSISGKAVGMDDRDELMPLPEGLSVIHGDTPVNKLVPRAGMRELPTPDENPLYAKIFGTDELG